jgi:selenocysteine lyase/cysteine desulfurase
MNIIAHMLSDKGIVISNELEFPSTNLPWLNKNLANIKFVKAKDGNKILIKDISNMLDKYSNNDNYNKRANTIVTSHVQFSTGFTQDLEELGKLTRQKGMYFVVNSTQSSNLHTR